VYIHDKIIGKCIWWNKEYRRWWVGPCQNVGGNAGFAYINEDAPCPYTTIWRRGGSNEIISGVQNFIVQVASAGAQKVDELTATVGVNAIIQNRTYKQKCKFTYRNGKIRCL
jgi:hypothetical protein